MTKTNIYLGADHAGFKLNETLRKELEKQGVSVKDFSPTLVPADDYPIYARKVARAVQKDRESVGVLVCGTGHGMEMAADRFKRVRAFVARTDRSSPNP